MTNSYEPMDNRMDEIPPPSAEDSIEEADIRVLPDGWESDSLTLVGLGPSRRRAAAKPPEKPVSQRMPASEPPGPWGSHGADDDLDVDIPPSIRGRRLGIWGAAIPLLVVLAGVAIVGLRGLAPRSQSASAANVVPQVEATDNAGLFVRVADKDVRVMLDGRERGVAPLLLTGLTPGSHSLVLSGPGYEPFEQPVTLVANHVSTLEPVLTPRAAPPSEPAPAEKVAPQSVASLPVESAEDPAPKAKPARPAWLAAAPGVGPTPPVATSDASPELAAPVTGTLNVSSDPPSSVVVDGRPLGKAPRALELAPGAHTVVFVHPKEGRRSVTVNVIAGRETSAAVEF